MAAKNQTQQHAHSLTDITCPLSLPNRDQLEGPIPNPNQKIGCPRRLCVLAPMPEYSSPDPFSFSPYVDHRRGGGNSEVPDLPSVYEGGGSGFEEEVGDNFGNVNTDENDDDDEVFVDTKSESMRVASEVGIDDFLAGKQFDSCSSVSAQGDFFDANDDFSSDSSRTESELNLKRLAILEEIERRKRAEENLVVMGSQWERIGNLMSQVGLTFPALSSTSDKIIEIENDSIDKLVQEVVVARFVAEAVGRGAARAEAEEAAATIIESKDQEIVRLRDRLQYYKTVNHELSQRKLVETARRQQERKIRSWRRWMWTFVGVSVAAIGASFVAYSYIPCANECLSSLECSGDGDSTDHSYRVSNGT